VTYRVAGFLEKIKFLISVRSELNAHVLDALHENGIEIVSPSFMNQRVWDNNKAFIPKVNYFEKKETEKFAHLKPESLIFDKAEEAESKESIKEMCEKIKDKISQAKEKLKDDELSDEERAAVVKRVEDLTKREVKLLEMLTKFD